MNTTLAAAAGCVTWAGIEYGLRRKPSILGFCSGAVAGLATITPGSGFVTPSAAVLIGVLAGAGSYLACTKLKQKFNYDDVLDTFGVPAVGGLRVPEEIEHAGLDLHEHGEEAYTD